MNVQEIQSVRSLLEGGFERVRVLVAGDVWIDRELIGEADGVAPEAPVPVLKGVERRERPGGAAAVAVHLAGLGCQVFLAGLWGRDAEQRELARVLEQAKVDTGGMVTSTRPTGSLVRIAGRAQASGSQQIVQMDLRRRGDGPVDEGRELEGQVFELIPSVNTLLMVDAQRGAFSALGCGAVIRAARDASVSVHVEQQTGDYGRYSGAAVVFSTPAELGRVVGEGAVEGARRQLGEHELRYLVLADRGGARLRLVGMEEDFTDAGRAEERADAMTAAGVVAAVFTAGVTGGVSVRVATELARRAAVVASAGALTAAELLGVIPADASDTFVEKGPAGGLLS